MAAETVLQPFLFTIKMSRCLPAAGTCSRLLFNI